LGDPVECSGVETLFAAVPWNIKTKMQIASSIFKAYDIRGVVDQTLTQEAVLHIGRAYGLAAIEKGIKKVVIGCDGRLSGPAFIACLSQGLREQGVDVINIGIVPTPMVYFAGFSEKTMSGIMITGSHNPPQYNGLKMVLAGDTLYGDAIKKLYDAIESGATSNPRAAVSASESHIDVWPQYLARIVSDVKLQRPLSIVVDCGNGSPGAYVAKLYRALGCAVQELYCEVDGNFPNHHPDPADPKNLRDLIKAVRTSGADVGLAFDGDGDRLGVVTRQGNIIWPDRQLMLFACHVLAKHPGAQVVYDVKCSRHVAQVVNEAGGKPLMWKTGHSLIKAKMKQTGAALGGEMSGHIFFNDRWYGFDDALYTGARLLEILSGVQDPSQLLNDLPDSPCTPELALPLAEQENFSLIAQLITSTNFEGAISVSTVDGIRVEYPDGFGLARSSNTTPIIVMRFEADTAQALARIQAIFKSAILALKPDAKIPF
jgi:phosphomannomutase / phosphoglucomutase